MYEFAVEVGDELILSRVTVEEYHRRGLADAVGERGHVHLPADEVFTFPGA